MRTGNKRNLFILGIIVAKLALSLISDIFDQDSRDIHISNSNVVINYGYQDEFAPRTVTEPGYEIATQYGQNAIMRRCARQECAEIDALPDGSIIHVSRFVHGESIGGNDIWFRVEHNSRTGFVFGRLVREIGDYA